jgi:hypothetical protein
MGTAAENTNDLDPESPEWVRARDQARAAAGVRDDARFELADMFAELEASIRQGVQVLADHRAACIRRREPRRGCETCKIWICAGCGADTEIPEDLRDGTVRPALCEPCGRKRDREMELARSAWWLDTMGDENAAGTASPYAWADPARNDAAGRLSRVCLAYRASDPRRTLLGTVVRKQWACVLSGQTGAYKSTLASYMARVVLAKGRSLAAPVEDLARAKGIVFVAIQTLERKARAWALGKGECPEVAEARRATLLVLDDVGNEGDVGVEIVRSLLTERYEKRPTWVTTGLGRSVFAGRYGGNIERKVSRVWTDSGHVDTWIDMGGAG